MEVKSIWLELYGERITREQDIRVKTPGQLEQKIKEHTKGNIEEDTELVIYLWEDAIIRCYNITIIDRNILVELLVWIFRFNMMTSVNRFSADVINMNKHITDYYTRYYGGLGRVNRNSMVTKKLAVKIYDILKSMGYTAINLQIIELDRNDYYINEWDRKYVINTYEDILTCKYSKRDNEVSISSTAKHKEILKINID